VQNLSLRYKEAVTVGPATTLRELLPTLLDELPDVIEEVVGLLRDEWPDYALFLDDDPEGVMATAQAAVQRLVALAEVGPDGVTAEAGPGLAGGAELFEELGRIEWRDGRSLSSLLSAYRAGARVAWQRMSRVALRRGVAPEAIALLAEAVFVFIEELSSASARGYVDEQLATAAQRERLRAELAELLMSERADLTLVRTTAAAAGWPLPASVALVAVDPDAVRELLSGLDAAVLPVRRPELAGAIVADPDGPGRRSRLVSAARGLGAVVGMVVPPEQLASSVRVVVAAEALRRDGVLTGDPIFVDEHLDALVVHSDDWLLAALTRQALAPLNELPAGSRARLEETLTEWLRAMGDQQAVAATLHVHPQTVRYRLGRLRAAFGPALDEPATRLALTLALCWRRADEPPGPAAATIDAAGG
jgi:PucR C-terminal helix-turn-helix domain